MSGNLSKQIMVITGASRGIGRALAHRLAKEGAILSLAARSEQSLIALKAELESTYPECKVMTQLCNVTNPGECKSLIQSTLQRFGRLDVLINNAGIASKIGLLTEVPDEEIQATLNTNLLAPLILSKYALGPMVEQQSGTIININSIAGKTAFPFWATYDASKAGLKAMTEALCEEQRQNNIRVIGIYPGACDTSIWDSIDLASGGPNRDGMLSPEDVVNAVLFALNQPQSIYVNDVSLQPTRPAL